MAARSASGIGRLDGLVQVLGQRRRLGLGVDVDADDLQVAAFDPRATLRVRRDELALHVAGLDRGHGPAHRLDPVDLRLGALDELADLGLDDVGTVEDVLILQQVRLESQHLLQPQGPLLIPRARQAKRLVPRRQLDGAGTGVFAQRDAEHLKHDALDVVLWLGLGQAERVDLHAIAQAAHLGVLDAIAFAGDVVPELPEGPHLAGLLDEPDAGIDEERDASDDLLEVTFFDLPRCLDRIEHSNRRASA